MPTNPTPPIAPRPPGNLVERLYVLWITSSLLLVLLAAVLTLLGSGQLRRHARRIAEQAQAIGALREELSTVRQDLANLEAAASRPPVPTLAPGAPSAPAQTAEAEPSESQAPEDSVDERGISALLRDALSQGEDLPYEIADRAAAEEALRQALRSIGRAAWSGKTWARLAVLAGLLDRDRSAEVFAYAAAEAGELPDGYYELTARKLLDQGKVTDALVFAKRLAAGRPGDPRGVSLLAEVQRVRGDLGAVATALTKLQNTEQLPPAAMLRLGRLFVALEDWNRLDALLTRVGDVPQALLQPLNGLRARLAIHQGRLPEALAILDNLLAERAAGSHGPLARGEGGTGTQPVRAPLLALDDYDLRTWRGVALMEAGQFLAAREALAHVAEHPGRPEGWYWRGVLELRAGNAEAAIECLDRALAASHGFAPAWEALGTIALNRGQVATALQNLSNAADANPSRASTHFLLAVVHAKASRPKETVESLRTAFRLDQSLLEAAKKTEVIRQLLSDNELEALAGVDAPGPADAPVESNRPEPE